MEEISLSDHESDEGEKEKKNSGNGNKKGRLGPKRWSLQRPEGSAESVCKRDKRLSW